MDFPETTRRSESASALAGDWGPWPPVPASAWVDSSVTESLTLLKLLDWLRPEVASEFEDLGREFRSSPDPEATSEEAEALADADAENPAPDP